MNGLEFADPSIIRTPAGWTRFATNHDFNGKMINVLVATTPDYETWTHDSEKFGTDARPHLPEWVDPSSSRVWASDVQQLPDGSFILYYTAALKEDPAHHCVSWAISPNVSGPYTSGPNKKPWIYPFSIGGAIDPSSYYDPRSNSRWVVYNVDGKSIGHGGVCGNTMPPIVSTPIMLQQISVTDGRTFVGKSYQLIANGPLDGPVVEAPSLTNLDGKYVLFFSSNCFATTLHDVSYGTDDALTGPWKKYGPLFVTGTDGLVAPRGLTIAINGNHAIFYGSVNLSASSSSSVALPASTDPYIAEETDEGREKEKHRHADEPDRNFGPAGNRAAYTVLLSRSGNLVTAGVVS